MTNSKNRTHLVSLLFLSLIASGSAFANEAAKSGPSECTKDWATDGQMKGKNIFGLGVSSKPDRVQALEEAKTAAYRDVGTQLQTSVRSESKLNETEDGSTYSGSVNLASNGKDLVGIRIVKEGSNPSAGITHCSVAKFDVSAAYSESEGQMNVLEKQLKEAFAASKAKKYIEVLQRRQKAHQLVKEAEPQIVRADMFRMFLKADSDSWVEKIKGQLADLDQVADEAKAKIAFILPSGSEYEGTLSDVESRLSGAGFDVVRDGKSKNPVRISLEIKPLGAPRKTKTALGQTLTTRISVALKDQNGKTIATNKGAQVIGTGSSEDDAVANIDRQLLVHVMGVFDEGLPGLIPDAE